MTPEQAEWYKAEHADATRRAKPWRSLADQFRLDGIRNFTAYELACRGTGLLSYNVEAVARLQKLRSTLGQPLLITSGYRSPQYNESLPNSSSRSMHMVGLAFDISLIGLDPRSVEEAAREVGFRGIGRYPRQKFIHIDLRPWDALWGRTWN